MCRVCVKARPKLVPSDEEKKHLDQLRQSRTAAFGDVQRARTLWRRGKSRVLDRTVGDPQA